MVTKQTGSSGNQTSRTRAIEAYDSARRKAAGGIEDSPLLALAGGLAAGAVLAALIPASRKERELLGPVADRIKDRASDAVEAAKDAGQARLDELGLTRDKGTDALRSIVEGAGDAFKASAEAAVASIRGTEN
ncbi:hypothetical protein [Sphingomonas alba]|uniref:YtxH domain-containing protein n=1 Tax=Sphingomonas alba TaxID=2908208 RepID=A0ABT0RIP5_9SPHN|nr:hypothetical protein [Sphingomonas alba]MCL6682496.1 hypothetical protein [Sphingomonas alba]